MSPDTHKEVEHGGRRLAHLGRRTWGCWDPESLDSAPAPGSYETVSFPVHGHLILGGGDKLGSQNSAGLKHTPLSDV